MYQKSAFSPTLLAPEGSILRRPDSPKSGRRVRFDDVDKLYPASSPAPPTSPPPRPASSPPPLRSSSSSHTDSRRLGPENHAHFEDRPSPPRKDKPSNNITPADSRNALKPEATQHFERTVNPLNVKNKPKSCRHQEESGQKRKNRSNPGSPTSFGTAPEEAVNRSPPGDFESLRKRAKQESMALKVWSANNIDHMSQHLELLDQKCGQIRKSRDVLRDKRRSLHTQMISYLRTTDESIISRAELLKHEETLSMLDAAIDEWGRRLEKVFTPPSSLLYHFI